MIVQADFYNQRIANVLVAAVTTNLRRRQDSAHFFIDVTTPDGRVSGLDRDSLVSCLNLAVMPKADLIKKIGEVTAQNMDKIDECLKAAFGLG